MAANDAQLRFTVEDKLVIESELTIYSSPRKKKLSTEQVLELDTSTVKSIINDIIECSDSVAKIIKETMQSSDVVD